MVYVEVGAWHSSLTKWFNVTLSVKEIISLEEEHNMSCKKVLKESTA